MGIHFTEDAWEDYLNWQGQDKKTLKRINKIIKDMQRHPFEGIAKPEPLKYDYQGAWSRRIDAENRLIYMVEADQLYILSLKDHYK
ncbi:Txe/YoeB family addiction module toxin [Streptococcus suis]|uniref:Endoribonuclease YoeB n=1 Tax=Streptococcus suis TaxID=1307 RepID=A0A0Z8X212_STRSU|nr:Txe/YoeB family addiction module toxin [Streptococcus suis]MBY4991144.1 Txe/YoeB family addiction module toxin [Streptococcus suis]NQK82051.1 Txe/YoeB family addiction module toxin [Streptococcus suis]NQR96951.1 Txe/YoeB family addiction module toxin [Streptococcus suis]QZT29197.1 Txe/YoeB family addiction module toxin [Streptococcus suis]CYX84772.1 toxin-antitoxin system%2C toxin protein [Streptococcus suis]